MAKLGKKSAKRKPEQQELPVEGPGVSSIKIAAIDRAFSDYEPKKNDRVEASKLETTAKQKLMDLLHKHKDEIGTDRNGVTRYRLSDGRVLKLEPTDEKLVIEKPSKSDGEE